MYSTSSQEHLFVLDHFVGVKVSSRNRLGALLDDSGGSGNSVTVEGRRWGVRLAGGGGAAPPDGWGWGCPHRLAVAREKAWGTQGAGPAGPVEQMPCVGLRGWAERSLAAGGLGIWSAHADSRRLHAPAGWEMGPVVDRQAEYLVVFSWKTPGTPRWAAVGSRICTDRSGGIAWNPSPPPTGRSGGPEPRAHPWPSAWRPKAGHTRPGLCVHGPTDPPEPVPATGAPATPCRFRLILRFTRPRSARR